MKGRINVVYTDFPTCLISLYLDFEILLKKIYFNSYFKQAKVSLNTFYIKNCFQGCDVSV